MNQNHRNRIKKNHDGNYKIQIGRITIVQRFYVILMLIFILNACASSKLHKQNLNNYSVERFLSVDGRTYLSLNSYHFDNKTEPVNAFFHVNGIIFEPNDNYQNRVIPVMPGTYNVKSGFVGKELSHAEINVERKDSVVVKFYLKDNPEPLHSFN